MHSLVVSWQKLCHPGINSIVHVATRLLPKQPLPVPTSTIPTRPCTYALSWQIKSPPPCQRVKHPFPQCPFNTSDRRPLDVSAFKQNTTIVHAQPPQCRLLSQTAGACHATQTLTTPPGCLPQQLSTNGKKTSLTQHDNDKKTAGPTAQSVFGKREMAKPSRMTRVAQKNLNNQRLQKKEQVSTAGFRQHTPACVHAWSPGLHTERGTLCLVSPNRVVSRINATGPAQQTLKQEHGTCQGLL